MDAKDQLKPLRLTLRTGAIVFGFSALALLALPGFFNQLLGFSPTPELNWAMQMIGITLVALTGNMFYHSVSQDPRRVRNAARVMQFSAFFLGVITLLIPTGINWFVTLYALTGFGFSIAYTIFLRPLRG